MGAEQLQQFQLHMLRDQKLATGTVENRMTALHFFFKKVLKRYDIPIYTTCSCTTGSFFGLSPEEVEKLIAAAPNIRYRTILLLLYATGLRRAEAQPVASMIGVGRTEPGSFAPPASDVAGGDLLRREGLAQP